MVSPFAIAATDQIAAEQATTEAAIREQTHDADGEMSRQSDLKKYVAMMESGNPLSQKEAAQLLEWAGLSDPMLFDIVEKEVQKLHDKGRHLHKSDIDLMAWLIKALSFSGEPKYVATVEKIRNESQQPKVRKYAKIALPNFSQYEKWNPIINSKEHYNSEQSAEINRFANMLRSEDFDLMRLAAKRVHYKHIYNDYLLSILSSKVDAFADYDPKNGNEVDSVAWMTKALAGSRELKYKRSVEKMAATAKHVKLQKYAHKYLNYYNK